MTGDVLGFGLDVANKRVFYTKNGIFLGYGFENISTMILRPCVTFKGEDCSVRLNSGSTAYQYNGIELFGRNTSTSTSTSNIKKLSNKYSPASICITHNKLYLHSFKLLRPCDILVFNLETLQFEGLMSLWPKYIQYGNRRKKNKLLSETTHSSVCSTAVTATTAVDNTNNCVTGSTTDVSTSADKSEFIFIITGDESLHIVGNDKNPFIVTSAVVNDKLDVTNIIQEHCMNSDCTILHIRNITDVLSAYNNSNTASSTSTSSIIDVSGDDSSNNKKLIIKVKYTTYSFSNIQFEARAIESLTLPICSDGKHTMFLERSAYSQEEEKDYLTYVLK